LVGCRLWCGLAVANGSGALQIKVSFRFGWVAARLFASSLGGSGATSSYSANFVEFGPSLLRCSTHSISIAVVGTAGSSWI